MPNPYPGIESPPLKNLKDVENEIERIARVVNEGIDAVGLNLARLTMLMNKTVDLNGDLKRKINWLNIKYEGIRPKNMHKSLRPFATNACFRIRLNRIVPGFPPTYYYVIDSADGPVWPSNANSTIQWAGEQYAELITTNTSTAEFTITYRVTQYAYIDTNEIRSGGYSVAHTTSTSEACSGGRVILYKFNNVNRAMGSTTNWRQGSWGGGSLDM